MAIQYIGGNEPYTSAASLVAPTPAPVTPVKATPTQTAPTVSPMQQSPSGPVTLQDGTQLDSGVVKVLHAIRNIESSNNYNAVGDNGSSLGAYQWNNDNKPLKPGELPSHFIDAAKQYGLDPNDFSPANQNKLAYLQVADYKAKGLTPLEIDAVWNGAHKDQATGKYVHNAPERATLFQNALQQEVSQTASGQPATSTESNGTTNSPSVGGFLGNVVKSGANFVGNTADALLHPIQTVQNIGGTAVGALQELGGQENENTQKFDALKQYFTQKYGGVSNIEKSLYEDPISVLADISTIFSGVGGVIGGVGKLGELGGLEGVADAANTARGLASKAGEYTNPLTPVAKGVTALTTPLQKAATYGVSKAMNIGDDTAAIVQKYPDQITNDAINNANYTRVEVAKQVEQAFQKKEAEFSDTGKGYEAISSAEAPPLSLPAPSGKPLSSGSTIPLAKESLPEGYLPAVYPLKYFENTGKEPDLGVLTKTVRPETSLEKAKAGVKVSHNFLEEQLRKVAALEVKDGVITTTTTSKVGRAELSKLQDILDTFKPSFQKGFLTNEEFLTLRTRLAKAAFNDSGIKNAEVARIAAGVRENLNKEYRPQISGLEKIDEEYSSQLNEIKDLRKGLFDKDGNLLPAAINKIANATGKGKDLLREKLEQIMPGITKKIEIQKALEDINDAATKPRIGTYTESILKGGGLLAGISTGNIGLIAGSLALAIIGKPSIAVPLLKAFDFDKQIVSAVSSKLARYVTLGAVSSSVQTSGQDQQKQDTTPQTQSVPQANYSSSDLTNLASNKGFDLQSALAAGYTTQQIEDFLKSQP